MFSKIQTIGTLTTLQRLWTIASKSTFTISIDPCVLSNIHCYRKALLNSIFYKDLTGKLFRVGQSLFWQYVLTELAVIFEKYLLPLKQVDIVCYGIGSMQKTKNAQYQFVLALILRDLLKVSWLNKEVV